MNPLDAHRLRIGQKPVLTHKREAPEELKEYFTEDWVIEILEKSVALNYLKSKLVVAWGNGEIKGTGYYQLAIFSPEHKGDKRTVFVCKKSLIKEV